MTCRGDLLAILEARERVNRDLKRQDEVIAGIREVLADQEIVHNELFATWRLVNNELAQAAAEVFPSEGVVREGDLSISPTSREIDIEFPDPQGPDHG